MAEVLDQLLEERRKKTRLVLANVYNLPAMSKVMMEVSNLLDDPATSTATLGEMVGQDQGLATKILSIANSPLYGLPRKVSTIDFAILIIGYQDIKNIVIALSMIESFKNKSDKNLDQKDFWLHSIIMGNAAKRIAEDLSYRIGSEAFVAGLLHDLGIPVIHKYFHTSFESIMAEVKDEGKTFLEAEFNQLGYTHQDIGKFLAEKWNLPDNLGNAIQFHHEPSKVDENNKELAAVIHLADYMTQRLGIGKIHFDENFVLDKSIIDTLSFKNEDELNTFVDGYKQLFEEEIGQVNFI